MDAPRLTDEVIARLYAEVCADPTQKDAHGPFFYRALLENLIASRQVSVMFAGQVNNLMRVQPN